MSGDENDGTGDYEVGKGKPPKHTRFPKGRSGNPRGRPRTKKVGAAAITGLLEKPVTVRAGRKVRKISPFEAGFRQTARRALEGNLRSIIRFIRLCEEYGVLVPPEPEYGGGVVVAPQGVDFFDWLESVTEPIPPDET
jgi:hypothetical protein